jgi:RND family efflux transporter MFP subunit
MRRSSVVVATLVAVAVVALLAWRKLRPLEVTLAHPSRGPAVEAVYATGLVEPTLEIRISPRAPGRIVELNTDEGAEVKKGEQLARLEDADLRASVAELEARTQYAKAQYERSLKLRLAALIAQDAVDQAKTEFDAAQATLKRAREQLAYMRLVAPSSGRITKRDGEIGEYIPANQVIFYMAGPAPLRVTADVDEEDVPRVKPGLRVVMHADAFPDRIFEGRVDQVTPRGDPVARSYRVRVGLVGDPPLNIGMTIETNIIVSGRQNALLVPSSSVVEGRVWIAEGEHARRRPAKIGVIGADKTEILAGLSEKDLVIAHPPENLSDGARIKAAPAPVATSDTAQTSVAPRP